MLNILKIKKTTAYILLSLLFSLPAFALEPTNYDIIMFAGEDYLLQLQVVDPYGAAVDITGNSYKAQFRKSAAPTGILFATYSTTVTNAATGRIDVKLSRAQTTANSGNLGQWDLLQTDSTNHSSYLLRGIAIVRPTYTR